MYPLCIFAPFCQLKKGRIKKEMDKKKRKKKDIQTCVYMSDAHTTVQTIVPP
jgi:hypothetical protein